MTRKTVFYDTLVPSDSPLRRMPLALDTLRRLQVDALVFSADAIDYNWHTLVQTAEAIQSSHQRVTGIRRAALLSSAWSIVDELDAARQLVMAILGDGTIGPVTAALLHECEAVKKLRDKKRHLSQNLRNIEGKIIAGSKSRSPLLGSLSWLYCADEDSGEGTVLFVQAGMLHGGERIKPIDPHMKDFDPPVGMFQLDAFEITLDLRTPIVAFANWIEGATERWANQLKDQVERYVAAGGDRSTVETPADSDFALAMPIEINLTPKEPRE